MEFVFWKAIVWKKATNHNQAHSGIEDNIGKINHIAVSLHTISAIIL